MKRKRSLREKDGRERERRGHALRARDEGLRTNR